MNKTISVLSAVIIALAGCSRFKKGEGDMVYKIYVDKPGTNIKEDDFMAIAFTEKTEDDSLLSGSFGMNNNLTLMFRERSRFKGDLFAALGMLSEGDSAVFKINNDSVTSGMGRRMPGNTKGKYRVYNIRVNKVIARGNDNDSMYNARIETFRKAVSEKAKANEASIIKSYVAMKKLNPLKVTETGLKYVLLQKGEGSEATPGDTVLVKYTAQLLNGRIVDTCDSVLAETNGIYNESRQYGPMKLRIEDHPSLSGFQQALGMFPKGTKALLIIPSKLAYGEKGYRHIAPYTPLVCTLEIIDILSASPGRKPDY